MTSLSRKGGETPPSPPAKNKNPFGVKIVISAAISRDGGCGGKIFTMVPAEVDTVREFKNHLATNVLKTHIPFYFYNGEYRILDEDDVRVFTVLTEPCRIMPVPQPKSALSTSCNHSPPAISSTSTPLGAIYDEENSSKRVKFVSDASSILMEPSGNLQSSSKSSKTNGSGGSNYLSTKFTSAKTTSPIGGRISQDGNDQVDSVAATGEQSPETGPTGEAATRRRKRKRNRTPRSKKREKSASLSPIDNDATNEAPKQLKIPPGILQNLNTMTSTPDVEKPSRSSRKKSKIRLHQTQSYDADESAEGGIDFQVSSQKKVTNGENGSNGIVNDSPMPQKTNGLNGKSKGTTRNEDKSAEFLSPNTAFLGKGYKRLRNSNSLSTSTLQDTPSFYNGSFLSAGSSIPPTPLSSDESFVVEKRRQDTPMLPRVLKNPCSTHYNFVKKSLSFNSGLEHDDDGHEEHVDNNGEFPHADNTADDKQEKANNGEGLQKITSIDEINVGDTIGFKILELDENYSPVISNWKTAIISEKNGTMLALHYIGGNTVKQRSGTHEIEDEELMTETLDPSEREFESLIEPYLISKKQ